MQPANTPAARPSAPPSDPTRETLSPAVANLLAQPLDEAERGILTRWAVKIVDGLGLRSTPDKENHARSLLRYEATLRGQPGRSGDGDPPPPLAEEPLTCTIFDADPPRFVRWVDRFVGRVAFDTADPVWQARTRAAWNAGADAALASQRAARARAEELLNRTYRMTHASGGVLPVTGWFLLESLAQGEDSTPPAGQPEAVSRDA